MTISVAAEPALTYLLASLRIGAWLFLVPPFSTKGSPNTARVVLAVGLSFGLAPAVVANGLPTGGVSLVVVAITQVAIGLALGFVAQLILGTIAAAGSLIDVFGGFALAQGF